MALSKSSSLMYVLSGLLSKIVSRQDSMIIMFALR